MPRVEPIKSVPLVPHQLPEVEVLVVADAWAAQPLAASTIERAIAAAANAAGCLESECELAVMLTDDAGILRLNSEWRGIDKPTNVLSFPALPPLSPAKRGDPPRMLGDIAIAYDTTRREADEEGKSFGHHLSHLAVHGYLHLVGFDHEIDADADVMEQLERDILAKLQIADPYADRDGPD